MKILRCCSRHSIRILGFAGCFSICLAVWHFYFRFPPRYRHEAEDVHDMVSVAGSLPDSVVRSVALGCAVTTKGLDLQSKDVQKRVESMPFFTELLPSFCKTATGNFKYGVYVGYDKDDPLLSLQEYHQAFRDVFAKVTDLKCVPLQSRLQFEVTLILIRCNHSGQPARAQNDAMMAARADGMAYLYRVNDDTVLTTPDWTVHFIKTLLNFRPPNVGVVGPSFEGNDYINSKILTYEFVHRRHVDIFGYYYPPLLTDWFADDWVTHVYQPNRSVRLTDVIVLHTQTLSQRYQNRQVEQVLHQMDAQIDQDRETLRVWIAKNTLFKL